MCLAVAKAKIVPTLIAQMVHNLRPCQDLVIEHMISAYKKAYKEHVTGQKNVETNAE